MRVAVNWACYIAYAQSENEDHQKAVETNGAEAMAFGELMKEIQEQSTSRG